MQGQVQGVNPQEEGRLAKLYNAMGRRQYRLTHSAVIKHF